MSQISRATEADIPRIIDMVVALAAAVDGPQRVDRVRTGETIAGLLHDPDGLVLVTDGGFIAGVIMQTVISPEPVAAELGWYAQRGHGQALLMAFEAWARERGARLVKMSCAGGRVQTMLEAAGYRMAEVQMVKEV